MIDRTQSMKTQQDQPSTRHPADRAHRITAAVAPLLGEPRAAAPLTSQYLSGQRVDVLEERGDWLRIRGVDAYEGWMHVGYVGDPMSRSSADERLSLGCSVRRPDGRRRALPLGALLDADEVVLDGEQVLVAELASHFPTEGSAIAGSAIRFFEGTSYLWGGVTPWGADCSGLVQSVYALHGIALPRDAGDQARCGAAVPATADALVAGDLVFFSDREDGRITHVAIAMGHARMVHLGLGRGGYAVETLRGETDAYGMALRTRISFARRVIGA
jgi:cell wall-associated NlpC family hydrolase